MNVKKYLYAGAKKILINIAAKDMDDITYEEGNAIVDYIQAYASYKEDNGMEHRADIIWGISSKEVLEEDVIEVVVVATGFDEDKIIPRGETFPSLGSNIEILQQPEKTDEDDKSVLMPPRAKEPIAEPKPSRPLENPDSPITLARRPSKYLNLDAEMKLPSFVRRNVKFVTENGTAGPKETLRVDAEDEAASKDNRLSF